MTHTYEDLVRYVYEHGKYKDDRTGTGTFSVTGGQIRYDLREGFPLITTKRVFLRGVIEELLWFIRGSTNAHELRDKGVHIWDAWAPEDGDLGPVYGYQWRNWVGADGLAHDQLLKAINTLRQNPESRRIIVNAWNVGDLDKMALPPCHMMFQFVVQNGRLDCVVTQRSADMLLGVPFDIASYAALTLLVAQQTDLIPGELIWNGGDCHIYANHVDQVKEQLSREPRQLPLMAVTPRESILDYTYEDFMLIGYDPWPAIKAPVAI